MSPSKQKSNERQSARDRKDSSRQAASGGLSASAYNPTSGTFHTLEPSNPDSETRYLNGRFKSIDDTDDNASSHGGGADVDCMSNNGSCSGESEDQLHTSGKEKNMPANIATSKREKIRGKNERKHQRQKERRAQELKDKCTGYLMSRKLEGLSQKLVAMGFLQERATMALIANDGHVEQSVAWLFEGGEGKVHEGLNPGGNLKIDITEELHQLLEIEKTYKIPRSDIERAVVLSEGDLEKALETLRARGVSPVSEEHHKVENRILEGEQSASLSVPSDSSIACQTRSNVTVQPSHQQSRRVGSSWEGRQHSHTSVSIEGLSKCSAQLQPSSSQSFIAGGVERGGMVQSVPAKTVSLVPTFTSISSAETGLVFGFGAPNPMQLFSGSVKGQAMHAPVKESPSRGLAWSPSQTNSQPIVAPKSIPIPSPPFSSSSWSPKGLMEGGSPSSVLHVNEDMRMRGLPSVKHSFEGLELNARYFPDQISSLLTIQAESEASGGGRGLAYDNASHPSPLPATHSGSPSGTSYGLFTGWGAGISQSSIDWSTGPIQNCDYRTIDWSMNVSPTTAQGLSSHLNSLASQKKNNYGWSYEGQRRVQTELRAADFSTDSVYGNGGWKVGPPGAGMHERMSMEVRNSSSHEWTSPFAGKALFNLPQTVSSTFF